MLNDRSPLVTYARALYPVGAALVLFPLNDIGSRLFPFNYHNLQWRFAIVGLGLSGQSVLIIGVTLLGLVAALRENRTLLRVLAVFTGLVSLVLIAGLGLFALDTLQLRGIMQNPAAKPQITKMAISASIAGAVHAMAFVGLTIGLLRATRRTTISKTAAAKPEAPVIVYSGAEKAGV
jgi:hypothetical protein